MPTPLQQAQPFECELFGDNRSIDVSISLVFHTKIDADYLAYFGNVHKMMTSYRMSD